MIINNKTQLAKVNNPEIWGFTKVMEMVKDSKMMDAIVTPMVSFGMYRLIDIRNRMISKMKNCKVTMHL